MPVKEEGDFEYVDPGLRGAFYGVDVAGFLVLDEPVSFMAIGQPYLETEIRKESEHLHVLYIGD